LFVFQDTDFSEWSDCLGIPCQMGRQKRRRTCLEKSVCNGEQIQERDCLVSCLNKNVSSSTPAQRLSDGKYLILIY
jgi:hypothetical protein